MKLKFLLLSLLWILFSPFTYAQESLQVFEQFKSIPILHEGRLKPLDTYARNLLLQLSGKDSYEHKDAIIWLSRILFTPEKTKEDKVFLINNPDMATALNISPDGHRRYSFAQLEKVYFKLLEMEEAAKKIPENQRSLVENEIIRVSENLQSYIHYSNSFIWAYPNSDFTISSEAVKTNLGLPTNQKQFSFIEIALKAEELKNLTLNLKTKKPDQLTPNDKELLNCIGNLFQWSQKYRNMPFSVIPIPESKDWFSLWDAISIDFSNEQTKKLIVYWQKMAVAYQQNNFIEFNLSAHLYKDDLKNSLSNDEQKNVKKFSLELIYHSSKPFLWARIFYILAFVFFVISFTSPKKLWYGLGFTSICAGFVIHTLGLIARIIIMSRPPVSSLYETFIFVGFISVLLGLAIEHFNRKWLGIVTSAICGTILLFIAGKYSSEGDTLKMLVAVLNSNFWLATHVTTITMGYAATCVAGILGHIWLVQAVLKKDQATLEQTYKTTLGILGVALTLTFLGTNLGGIWADQSWGRFWGWDPKENGALMIVIWTALLFHAKISKMIGPMGLAVGSVLGMIVVMWAWFGVNLLSIGLHSYGFTSGIATSLAFYVICEIIFIILTTLTISKK